MHGIRPHPLPTARGGRCPLQRWPCRHALPPQSSLVCPLCRRATDSTAWPLACTLTSYRLRLYLPDCPSSQDRSCIYSRMAWAAARSLYCTNLSKLTARSLSPPFDTTYPSAARYSVETACPILPSPPRSLFDQSTSTFVTSFTLLLPFPSLSDITRSSAISTT